MSNSNEIPMVGLENNLAPNAEEQEADDSERVHDPEENADDVESAEADRLAVEPEDEPEDQP